MKTLAISIAILLASSCNSVMAQEGGRIDKIKQTREIILGHPQTSVPFGYFDADQKPAGYTVEICQLVAKYIQRKLSLDALDIKYVPISSATRIPLIQNGGIDLECGSTTNTSARQEFVSFAPTTFVAQVILAARKDSNLDVNDLAAFRGKTIAATAGGTHFKTISRLSAEHNYNIVLIPTKDISETFMMAENGRAAAMTQDDALIYAAVAASKHPGDFVIGTKSLEVAPYGIMEPKDDLPFKALVDEAVVDAIKTGQVAALYQKYFMSPIPPTNLNLNYPMSDLLKRALEHPSDSGDPAVYQ